MTELTTLKTWAENNPAYTVFDNVMSDLRTWSGVGITFTSTRLVDYLVYKFGSVIIPDYRALDLAIQTSIWHTENRYHFEGMYNTTIQNYSPIENYDRTETETETTTPNLTDTETRNTSTAESGTTGVSGTTSTTGTSDATGKTTAFDTLTFANDANSAVTTTGGETGTTTTTHGKTLTDTGTVTHARTGNEQRARQNHTHGNIGITSAMDLLKQEREIVNFAFLDYYLSLWVHAFSANVWDI